MVMQISADVYSKIKWNFVTLVTLQHKKYKTNDFVITMVRQIQFDICSDRQTDRQIDIFLFIFYKHIHVR